MWRTEVKRAKSRSKVTTSSVALGRDNREHRTGNLVPGCVGLVAELAQQCKVARAGTDQQVLGLRACGLDERDGLRPRRGNLEDPPVGAARRNTDPTSTGTLNASSSART